MLAIFLAVVIMLGTVAVAWYLVLGEAQHAERGLVQCLTRYVPLQSLKVIIVVWQILTQVRSRLLLLLKIALFGLGWRPSGCR